MSTRARSKGDAVPTGQIKNRPRRSYPGEIGRGSVDVRSELRASGELEEEEEEDEDDKAIAGSV